MKLKALKNEMPTVSWRERMSDDDDLFTDDNIEASEEVLENYIDALMDLGEDSEQDDIMACVEEVVLKFNELNDEYDYFIETMEREELWEFIDKAARKAGLKVSKDADITEEWREW